MIADSDLAILISICVSVMTNLEGLSNSLVVVSPSLADKICHWPCCLQRLGSSRSRSRAIHTLLSRDSRCLSGISETDTEIIAACVRASAMTRDTDVETQAAHTESTPLLVGEQSVQSHPEQQEDQKRSARWYLWRIFWVIAAALVLAVFIKGWIDADGDVNVRAVK